MKTPHNPYVYTTFVTETPRGSPFTFRETLPSNLGVRGPSDAGPKKETFYFLSQILDFPGKNQIFQDIKIMKILIHSSHDSYNFRVIYFTKVSCLYDVFNNSGSWRRVP